MTTIPRPLSPDALAGLRSVAEVCEALRGWGRPDLAERIPISPRMRIWTMGMFR